MKYVCMYSWCLRVTCRYLFTFWSKTSWCQLWRSLFWIKMTVVPLFHHSFTTLSHSFITLSHSFTTLSHSFTTLSHSVTTLSHFFMKTLHQYTQFWSIKLNITLVDTPTCMLACNDNKKNVYNETSLFWASEYQPPHYYSQTFRHQMIDPSSYKLIMYHLATSLIQPLSFVPRVAGIARFHCILIVLLVLIIYLYLMMVERNTEHKTTPLSADRTLRNPSAVSTSRHASFSCDVLGQVIYN